MTRFSPIWVVSIVGAVALVGALVGALAGRRASATAAPAAELARLDEFCERVRQADDDLVNILRNSWEPSDTPRRIMMDGFLPQALDLCTGHHVDLAAAMSCWRANDNSCLAAELSRIRGGLPEVVP